MGKTLEQHGAKLGGATKRKGVIKKGKLGKSLMKKAPGMRNSLNEGTYVPQKGERGTGMKFELKTYQVVGAFKPGTLIKYGPNPKRPESKSFYRYAGYCKAKTVGESLKLGSKIEDLLWELEHKNYTILGGERAEAKEIQVIGGPAFKKAQNGLARFHGPRGLAFSIHDTRAAGQLEKEEQWRMGKLNKCEKLAKEFGLKPEKHLNIMDELNIPEDADLRIQRRVADEMARRKLQSGKKLTAQDMAEVLECWGFRQNTGRINVMPKGQKYVYSDTIGGIKRFAFGYGATVQTPRYPKFASFLNKWLKDNTPASVADDFCYTAINLNCNYAGARHRDKGNAGPSVIRAFGEFTGGELKYWPNDSKVQGGTVVPVEDLNAKDCVQNNIQRQSFVFDGNKAHEVTAFEGNRFSVVYFTCSGYAKFADKHVNLLKSLGFPWPTDKRMAKLKRKSF